MSEGPSDETWQILPSHYKRCFGCGREQTGGLHMTMEGAGNRVRGSFVVTEHHEGAPGLAHGGVIGSAMDEGMGHLLWLLNEPAVTAHLEVDFRRPVPVGSRLELEGTIGPVDGRKIHARMTGRVDGQVAVEGKAIFVKVGVEHFRPHAERAKRRFEAPFNP